jgi:hypothetical protein
LSGPSLGDPHPLGEVSQARIRVHRDVGKDVSVGGEVRRNSRSAQAAQ